MSKFEVMVLKLGDYMTEVFTYLYDDFTENSFFQTASTHAIRDLRTNDTKHKYNIHLRNRQVAKKATKFSTLCTAFINCIRIVTQKVNSSILYQSSNSAGE